MDLEPETMYYQEIKLEQRFLTREDQMLEISRNEKQAMAHNRRRLFLSDIMNNDIYIKISRILKLVNPLTLLSIH